MGRVIPCGRKSRFVYSSGALGGELTVALAKLATETFQETRRPLRLAIDTSIWIFQVQNGTDQGSNPALRTFYYRLCRLLAANVQPVFVFDGPKKPPIKRNQRTGQFHGGVSIEDMLTKRLIKTFGFDYWDAPGEAEAECAVFQKLGKVDIVITEDVDCVMFGAMKVGRELPDTKTRTHMQLYKDVKRRTGLDKDGLVLVAMMSGGDYLPAGVPGCGPKIAAEVPPSPSSFSYSLCLEARLMIDRTRRIRKSITPNLRLCRMERGTSHLPHPQHR